MNRQRLDALHKPLLAHEIRNSGGPMEINPADLRALLTYVDALEKAVAASLRADRMAREAVEAQTHAATLLDNVVTQARNT